MPSKQLIVNDQFGIHARPALALVKLSSKYRSRITLYQNSRIANCKSILEILSLAIPAGSVLVLTAEGEDASQVMDELSSLQKDGFEVRN